MSALHWLTDEEKSFIKDNCFRMTVTEISVELSRNPSNILNYIEKRLRLKPFKKNDEVREPRKRPPTVYTNSKSPYGIADELMLELAYLNPQMSKRIIK